MADKLTPKGTGAGGGFNGATSWSTRFPGRQQVPNPAQTSGAERGNLVSSPAREGEPQGELMKVRAWDVGKSEGRPVIGRIRVSMLPGTKVSPRPTGASLRESMHTALDGECNYELEVVRPPGGAPPPLACPELGACMLVSQRQLRSKRVSQKSRLAC